jgi:hypothetical protein
VEDERFALVDSFILQACGVEANLTAPKAYQKNK